MKDTRIYQFAYQTSGATDADHAALSQFFAVLDAATSQGQIRLNHSPDPSLLMLHLEQLYDVAAMLERSLPTPDQLRAHLRVLTWPRYLGQRRIHTTLWPNAADIDVMTFQLQDQPCPTPAPDQKTPPKTKERNMPLQLNHDAIEKTYLTLRAQLTTWADTVESVPPGSRISYDSTTLLTQLEHLQRQLDTLISLTAPDLWAD